MNDPEYYRRHDGTSMQTCLERIGGDWSKLATARRDAGEIAAFVELHVEQGGVLESTGDAIGVVKGIVGQYRHSVSVTGRPNHAGTTPMHLRKDAFIDMRDLSETHLDDLASKLEQQLKAIAAATQTEIVMTQALHVLPTPFRSKNSGWRSRKEASN